MNRNSLLACAGIAVSIACGSGVVPSGVAPGTVAPDMGKKIFAARSAGLTKTQREGIYNHCEYDLTRFCPEILPTDVNFFRQAAVCLSDHGADLTDDCSPRTRTPTAARWARISSTTSATPPARRGWSSTKATA